MSAGPDALSFMAPWPETPPVTVRCEPDYYGASRLISSALGLPAPPISRSTWVHGCDMFPMPREVFSPHFNTPDQTHLVAGQIMQDWFRERGLVRAVATGCPIVYTAASGRDRIPGSVLLMPSHSLPEIISDQEHAIAWVKNVAPLRSRYPHMAACVHSGDVDLLRPVLEEHGIEYFTGAGVHKSCLDRMRAIFESFELMITDSQGSHIPYAAWCGCRVALAPPLHIRRWEDIKMHPHMVKYPEVERNLAFHEPQSIRSRLPFLLPDSPEQATCPKEWADSILGTSFKRSPQEMARLLGWQWEAGDPAFEGLKYEDVAPWLGAANADPAARKWETKNTTLKQEFKEQGKALKDAEKQLQRQQPFLDSISAKIGRALYSFEKRLRRRSGD